MLEGQRRFDLLVRLEEPYRTDYANLGRLRIDLPDGRGQVELASWPTSATASGPTPSTARTPAAGSSSAATRRTATWPAPWPTSSSACSEQVALPEGYFVEYGGQFESQQRATPLIVVLAAVSVVGMFVVLLLLFPSVRIVLQILNALPTAFIGGVLALVLTGQTLTVASLVGFISLGGIAVRNGILLVTHYFHLMKEEGEAFTPADGAARQPGAAGAGADDGADGRHRAGAAGDRRAGAGPRDSLPGGDGDPGRAGDFDVLRVPDSPRVVLEVQRAGCPANCSSGGCGRRISCLRRFVMCRVFGFVCLSVVAVVALGCSNKPPPAPIADNEKAESGDHEHGPGPHGGTVADWGGGAYHVEFTVDHDKKQATVYILGSDEKTPSPVKAETLLLSINEPAFQVDLTPQPLEGESQNMSSRFVGQHDSLGTVRKFAGTISAVVDGKPFAGDFLELP